MCLALVLGVGWLVVVQFNSLEEELDRSMANSAIVRNVFNLKILADEYSEYNEERPLAQWKITWDTMRSLLLNSAKRNSQSSEVVNRLIEDHRDTNSAFSHLVGLHGKDSTAPDGSPMHKELEEKLKALLSVKLQSMVADASRLEKTSQAEMAHSHKVTDLATIAFVIVMALITVGSAALMYTLVLRPLNKLSEGADVVGAGNLDHRVDVAGPGELGDLAAAFNRMAANLKKSYEEMEAEVIHRKQAEKALAKQAEELARSNRDLEQFAYVASHDLQEPLRNVTNCVQLLEKRYKHQVGSDVVKLADLAVDSCARMKDLMDDLLEFSRVGTRCNPFEPCDCEQVLTRALANLRSTIRESGAVITHDPLPTLNADATQLSQLFQNLVSNGIKFRGKEPPQVHISAEENEHEWLFSVRDNGIGIDPQYKDRIFAVFQRLHLQSEYPGTGIGLAIAKKIVERHGGQIRVKPNHDGGSTFCFTIPTGAADNVH